MAPWLRWSLLFGLTLAAILVPFAIWGDAIEGWVRSFLASGPGWWTVAGVTAGALACDVMLPVPSSLVSTAAGALLGFPGAAAASWLGMSAGCLMGYGLGRSSPAERWIGPSESERLRQAHKRWGTWMLVVFRSVPVLAEASVFFAGVARMPLRRFALATGLSNLGIATVYAATGAWAATRESFLLVFAGAVVVPAIGLLLVRRP